MGEKIELEKEEAEAIERAKKYFAGEGKAFSQNQLDQLIGMADIDGINRQELIKFFDHWKSVFFEKDQDNYPPEWSKEAADFFIEFFVKPSTINGNA